ncbi:hypothetical protein, partial [Streptomyces sp. CRN 30]|uniref:hypothetical protein n=1 Tax=Streptomyces sp. CRN 30 TaxID=3075613 RepID=UPI002A826F67
MQDMHLGELIGRLRRGGLDPGAEELADALWLARLLGTEAPRDAADRLPHRPSGPPADPSGP